MTCYIVLKYGRQIHRSRMNSTIFVGGQVGLWTLRKSGVFFSIMARKNSTFISPKTCFDLFLYTGGWIEKLNFKEKYTESNSLIEEFLCYSNEVLMLRNEWKKNFSLKKCWRISVKLQSQHIQIKTRSSYITILWIYE